MSIKSLQRAFLSLVMLIALTAAATRAVASSPLREMRGAWLATVWGLDWPSAVGASPADAERQRAELRSILDRLQAMGMNAVFFQVRSMADAMYPSPHEPWSRFLTGQRGKAPADAGWDPLQFCIDEAHSRGMECHAWINPFRVTNNVALPTTPNDRMFQSRGWLITYKKTANRRSTSTTILDPGNPDVRQYIASICADIASRYDVDGIIFDDYFYPEGLPEGHGYDYDEYIKSGTSLSQADWRRENVAETIQLVGLTLRLVRPDLKFGISPAGVAGADGSAVARYGLPACYAGHDWMYDGIYCDPVRWLADGSIDYISPQIYWPHDHATNPYAPIARWWSEIASHFNRHSYPSVSVDRIKSAKAHSPLTEVARLVADNRAPHGTDAPGHIFYSTAQLLATGSPVAATAATHFPGPALTPEMTWRSLPDPGNISNLRKSANRLTWDENPARRFAVFSIKSDPAGDNLSEAASLIGISYDNHFTLPDNLTDEIFAVAPFDRLSRLWNFTILFPDGTTAVKPYNSDITTAQQQAKSSRFSSDSAPSHDIDLRRQAADSIESAIRAIFH